jgi:6-phosphogluconolactonase
MPRAVTVTYAVWPTPTQVAAAAAEVFASAAATAAKSRGLARIAISGGATPKAMFALLADRTQPFFDLVPWDKLHLFWVDERTVPPEHKDSNFGMTKAAMLDRVPLPAAQIHRIEGELEPEVAASRYEAAIRTSFRLEGAETPTFDLILLGMGDDGHTASLFPHTEAINELGRIAIANRVPKMDTWRVTLTWPVINQAREAVFLIEGAGKRDILREVLLGAYDPDTKPSQLIRPASGKLTFLLDAAAAAALPNPSGEAAPFTATLELR